MSNREVAYLLTSRGGLPHRNLALWSAEIARRLASMQTGDPSPTTVGRLVSITNDAALVEAHRGNYESAAEICGEQLALLRGHRDADRFAIARYAVNPWLNLGRLASLCGRTADACERFAVFRDSTKFAHLAGVKLHLSELNLRLRAEKGYPDFCAHVYVGNSLRALLRNGAWDSLAGFVSSCSVLVPPLRPIVDEARVLAALHQGRLAEALEIAGSYRDAESRHARSAFRIREVECRAALRERVPSESWLAIEAGFEQTTPPRHLSTAALALWLRYAEIALEHGERGAAERVATRCLSAAESLGDELYTHEALRLLSTCSTEPNTSSYKERSAMLAATSEYASIRGDRRSVSTKRALADAACNALAQARAGHAAK